MRRSGTIYEYINVRYAHGQAEKTAFEIGGLYTVKNIMPGTGLLLVCITFIVVNVNATHAAERFEYYTVASSPTNIDVRGGNVWCTTKGGVLCWDIDDSTYVKYTTADGLGSSKYFSTIFASDVNDDVWVIKDPPDSYYTDFVRYSTLFQFNGEFWNGVIGDALAVRDITEDSAGIVWMSHDYYSGLGFFSSCNGTEYTHYDPFPATKLQPTSITCDKLDNIWFGCDSTLVQYDGSTWYKHDIPGDMPASQIIDICSDPAGRIWAVGENGVYNFDTDNWIYHQAPDNIAFVQPTSIDCDSEGNIYVGVTSGFVTIKDLTWDYTPISGLDIYVMVPLDPYGHEWESVLIEDTDITIYDIEVDDYGRVICAEYGLMVFDHGSWTVFSESPGINASRTYELFIDKSNNVWFSAADAGDPLLSAFIDNQWTLFDITYAQHFAENDNEIWFTGHRGNSLHRYADNSMDTYDIIDERGIEQIVVDRNGILWCADTYKLYTFDGEDWNDYSQHITGVIQDIAVDNDNTIWLGTSAGVTSFDGEDWVSYTTDDGLADNIVTNVEIADNGVIWCVHKNSDVSSFDGTTWTSHIDNGGPTEEIFDIVSRGQFTWFATEQGVWQYDGASWERILEDATDEFAIDMAGRLWCDIGYGVTRYDGVSWTTYTRENGLIWHEVATIDAGQDGSMWIGSEQGLTRIIPDTPTSVTVKKPEPVTVLTAFPNPFNPSTTISFNLSDNGHVKLVIYNLTGQKVRTLIDEQMAAGRHTVIWDGMDVTGRTVAGGIYLSRLTASGTVATGKMVLVK